MEFEAKPLDTEIVGIYEFENVGDYPVTIREVIPSCGCTTAKLDKKVYQPGEVGQIDALFTLGHRIGLQRKNIRVVTDDEQQPVKILVLQVLIPELLRISPRLIYWHLSEEPTPKSAYVQIVGDKPIIVKSVSSSSSIIKPLLKTLDEGRLYEIILEPTILHFPIKALITLQTDYAEVSPENFSLHAMIR